MAVYVPVISGGMYMALHSGGLPHAETSTVKALAVANTVAMERLRARLMAAFFTSHTLRATSDSKNGEIRFPTGRVAVEAHRNVAKLASPTTRFSGPCCAPREARWARRHARHGESSLARKDLSQRVSFVLVAVEGIKIAANSRLACSLLKACPMNKAIASLGVLLLLSACSNVGNERVVSVSAFPVIRAEGGFGPDGVGTEGDSFDGYVHEYFCAASVTLRTEDNPTCTGGIQDCGKTFERVVRFERGACAAPGTPFTMKGVRMLAGGVRGGRNDLREDPVSGSCAEGFVLGRASSHPIGVSFADPKACASFAALFAVKYSVELEIDLEVVTSDAVRFVAARIAP